MLISTLALTVALGGSLAAASSCSEISGNYYCNAVTAVAYENVGFSGSYDEVTSMDDCTCSTSSTSFSGSLAPMNEDISLHFRGPMQIKQVAVYSAGSQSATAKIKKRDGHHVHEKRNEHSKRESHLHDQQHAVRREKRALDIVTEIVTVYETVYENPDGIATSTALPSSPDSVVYSSPSDTQAMTSTVAVVDNHVDQSTATYQTQWDQTSNVPSQLWIDTAAASSTTTFVVSTTTASSSSSAESSSSSTSSSAAPTSTSSTSSWSRFAYYNSAQGVSNGLTFLNNLGGTNGSGTWSSCWGSSLSYCNTDGVTAASDAQVLGDVSLPSNAEVIIFTDTPCTSSSCGYYRDGIPAFEGFTGDTKLFLLEFSMPSDTSSDASYNIDMPAVWFLNGKIPRTQQYGSCSCWNSGCGEFDAFEVLSTGSQYLTTTLHTWQGTDNTYGGGGTSDYFTRPTDTTMKAAILFDGNSQSIYLLELDSSTDFGDSISADSIAQWLSASDTVISIPS
ncbi:putative TOS1-like glycosyl hydrolase-domain-containing protein [Lipomyces doorenjongii]|uniref:putative TOS1-like glycosyl hydrolase-domain-containing protein n=1 Tax=Lipomyces doorenjongii TaxID=383834 RepID=UPI0034CFBBE9